MPASLLDRLAALADPRGRNGRQYVLVPLLGLCLVGTLAGHTTLTATAHFGRLRGHRPGHALGFTRGTMPCPNTLSDLLRDLDPDHLDRIIGPWVADRHPGGWGHLALDGKVVRGSRDAEVPGTHLLAAYAPHAAAVVAQVTVEATTNEHKAALRLLGVLPPLAGAVVTADAMFTHADVCDAIRGRGGDYVLCARGNQADLRDDLEVTSAAPGSGDFSPLPAGRVG
ncbi:ISAs1 family transposase [bacterium]|nr:ISAs1 family transposase [bacterium]